MKNRMWIIYLEMEHRMWIIYLVMEYRMWIIYLEMENRMQNDKKYIKQRYLHKVSATLPPTPYNLFTRNDVDVNEH
jgi:hypothetical protein